jgi:hypothetical protein
MNPAINDYGGRAPRRKENRGLAQDLVGLAQPFVLGLEPLDLLGLGRGDSTPVPGVDLGLTEPVAQRLPPQIQLLTDLLTGHRQRRIVLLVLAHHAHRSGLELGVVLLGHVLILHRKEAASNP